MRIISNFHDYYDGVQAHGQDRSLVFVRQRRELDDTESVTFPEPEELRAAGDWRGRGCSVYARAFWIAVAGKIYRGYRVQKRIDRAVDIAAESFVYDSDSLAACISRFGAITPESRSPRRRRRSRWERNERDGSRPSWLAAQGTSELRDFLIAREATVAAKFIGWNRPPNRA